MDHVIIKLKAQNPQMTTIMSSYLMGTNHNTENGFQQDFSNPMPLLNIKQEPMATHARNSDVRGDVNEHLKRMESVLGTGEISNELEFMEGNLHLGMNNPIFFNWKIKNQRTRTPQSN